MNKNNKEEIQFQIEQLRKDKLIYAVESAATSLIALLLFGSLQFIVMSFSALQPYIETIAFVLIGIPFAYWVYAMIGNLVRLKKVKELEKLLNEESTKKRKTAVRKK